MGNQRAKWNVVIADGGDQDGLQFYSPFTGVLADDEHGSKDPSLVYIYLGDVGELMLARTDAEAVVAAVLGPDADEPESTGKDVVANIVRDAETIAERLRAQLGLQTLTIVDPGGWGGVNTFCWEVGNVVDGEWVPADRKIG